MATDRQRSGGAYTRRELLGAASLTAAGLATASVVAAAAAGEAPPISSPDDRLTIAGGDPLKQDPSLDAANPDSLVPPATDHGDVMTFKYPFSFGRNRVQPGGWARQVTVRDLPVSTDLAGVNMRLTAGGVRELHWHLPAEWSMMLYGNARITGVDQHGRSFVSDVKEGDLWYFPPGIPHSIQGLEPDGCEFLLVFDDGNFSEFDTFSISDWVAHTPRGVLAKNFSVAEAVFNQTPKGELYIFQGQMPPALSMDRGAVASPQGTVPEPFDYHLTAGQPTVRTKSGEVRIADSSNFKISKSIASALVTVRPGGVRELHWHPNANEWQYYISGKARMTVFAAAGRARTMDFDAGDVGYVQRAMGHYIENTGDTDLRFLEMFKSDRYEDISLAEWMSHTPPELVAQHLHLDMGMIESIPKKEMTVVPV